MDLQLKITDKIPAYTSRIFLIPETGKTAILPLTEKEKKFVKHQIRKKEKIIVVNQYNRWIFIVLTNETNKKTDILESLRINGYRVHKKIVGNKIKTIGFIDYTKDASKVIAFTEGLILSNYQFLKYFQNPAEKKYSLSTLYLPAIGSVKKEEFENLQHISEAVYFARDLINEPVMHMNSIKLAEEIKRMGDQAGFQVDVFEKNKIKALKMGGLLAVNKGSVDPPTFSVLEWKPQNPKNKKPVILVGKGVVFDTGGLSLKPTKDSMDYMKSDMSGAAAVAGTLYAAAKCNLPVHLIGLVPATDNRPDGNAYTPGDVITMGNGLTVEVLNTDAEGRMILAEALHYAAGYQPEIVIDLATLTGAAAVAVGKYGIVGMGNASKKIFKQLLESGKTVGERIVRFPFWNEYNELLKSDIADLKNIGGRDGGAITAGKFLEHFTQYPYIHLDIAGPAYVKTEYEYRGIGGTGYGIRLLFDFLSKYEPLER